MGGWDHQLNYLPATKRSLLDIPGLFHTIHTRFVPCGQLIGPEGTPYRTLIHKVHDLCKGFSELMEKLRGLFFMQFKYQAGSQEIRVGDGLGTRL